MSSLQLVALLITLNAVMVNVHGIANLRKLTRMSLHRSRLHEISEGERRPADPRTLLRPGQLEEKVGQLLDWLQGKSNVLAITGAGLSTESGIPDYRGSNGSYHRGYKPLLHDQFLANESQRKRYWGRGLVGWRKIDRSQPNSGHIAMADLERLGVIGVTFEDSPTFHAPEHEDDWAMGNGQACLSIITQNVDRLHQKAGANHVTELHGRIDRVKCMTCGASQSREFFHEVLEDLNREWLDEALKLHHLDDQRPDGDAQVTGMNYDDVVLSSCPVCQDGFLKPDVVLFGDTVPKHRVERCKAAVRSSDGLLCVGTSLAVHSAFRFIRIAESEGIPIAILNVGETRAETVGVENLLKVEAPVGSTLSACVTALS